MPYDRGRAIGAAAHQDIRAGLIAAGDMPVPVVVPSTVRASLRDIGSPDLAPNAAMIDALTFRASVTTAGVVTQASNQSIIGGFWGELFAISAWMENPGTDPELTALMAFSIRDGDRQGNLLSTDLYIADFFNTAGGSNRRDFPRGLYRFDPGSKVSVKFTPDLTAVVGYAAKASETKYFGVTLWLNLYAVRTR